MQALMYHGPGKRALEDKSKSVIDKKEMYSHFENGDSWILRNLIDKVQAEYVRVPFADITSNAMRDAQAAVLLDTEQRERIAQAMPTRPMKHIKRKK